tara:strand:+ start:116 stop:496 length:381 start_codon:yes stop_codon:yes gene_type:complete
MILKIKNLDALIKLLQMFLIFVFLVIFPINTNSAEILQINDPNNILVGDQNRSLNLSLYCIDINKDKKEKATEILKINFPRGTKVKIKPYGTNDNRLLAKIFRIEDEIEMSELLSIFNSSVKNCKN